MDKKNAIIGILILVLGATIYFNFQNIQPAKIENEASNSPNISAIPPSQALLETARPKQESTMFSQSSKEYAVMGREAWSAFRCSSWASINNDAKEQERLFLFGYEKGQKFLSAIKAEKIKQEDISLEVPIGVTMLIQGPTEEFILGRIFETAQEEALDEVLKTGDEFNSDEMQRIISGNKFRDGNCQLIRK